MAQLCERLNDFPVKSLKVVLEQVYAEHNSDLSIKYSLNASAREAFFKFAKPQELDLTRPRELHALHAPIPNGTNMSFVWP